MRDRRFWPLVLVALAVLAFQAGIARADAWNCSNNPGWLDCAADELAVQIWLVNEGHHLDDNHTVYIHGKTAYKDGDSVCLKRGQRYKYYLRSRGTAGTVRGPDKYRTMDCAAEPSAEWTLDFVTLEPDFFNGERKLDCPTYWIWIHGWGKVCNDIVFHMPPEAKIKYYLNSRGTHGTIRGPDIWETMPAVGGYVIWYKEWLTLHPWLFNDTKLLDNPDTWWIWIHGWGKAVHCTKIHLPPGARIKYYRNSRGTAGIIRGPDIWETLGSTDNLLGTPDAEVRWHHEYVTLHPWLFNGPKLLDNPDTWWIWIHGWGKAIHCHKIHLPPMARIKYFLNSKGTHGTIRGPDTWETLGPVDNDPGTHDAEVKWYKEYITLHPRFFNGPTELRDPNTYWIWIHGWGKAIYCHKIHLPPGARIKYFLNSRGTHGTIRGPDIWETLGPVDNLTSTPDAEVPWEHEYVTLIVDLFNGLTKLTDGAGYWLWIHGWGKAIHDQHVHMPPGAKVKYFQNSRGTHGTIRGPDIWKTMPGVGGDVDWLSEYATVIFKWCLSGSCVRDTWIHGWGAVQDGGTAHLPDGARVKFFGRVCGCRTSDTWQTFERGDSTWKWCGGALSRPCTPPPAGMISWWPLDENVGPTATDIQDGNHGTWKNGPTPVAGKVLGALSFDGQDDYVEVPDSANLDLTGAISIDAWVKRESLGEAVFATNKRGFTDPKTGYGLNARVDDHFSGTVFGKFGHISSATVPVGTWVHIAWTYDRTAGKSRLYLNGVLDSVETHNDPIVTNDDPLTIGGKLRKYAGGFVFGGGAADEVEIYNRALTAAEVKAIYDAGSAGKCK